MHTRSALISLLASLLLACGGVATETRFDSAPADQGETPPADQLTPGDSPEPNPSASAPADETPSPE